MDETRPSEPPRLVTCDDAGQLREHEVLEAVGVAGPSPARIPRERWIRVPEGSDLFMLPERAPVAWDPRSGRIVTLDEPGVHAASVFLAPAWTRSHLPAYRTRPGAPVLPLYAYAVVGLADEAFWTTGARVDEDPRQDPWTFDSDAIRAAAFSALDRSPDNRVLQQVSRCALEYGCRAAQNFFLGRHEAPLPTSVACNAQCVGCISLQPDGEFRASHERLTRRVRAEELAEVARAHWARQPDGVVSFGQGCEGEPLLEGELLVQTVRLLRSETDRGTLNLNTNGSLPEVVAALADAGLDTMRVSLNSARHELHEAYYRPRHYGLTDVRASIRAMKSRGRGVSLNLLYFPGVSDTEPEVEAWAELIASTGVDMVQLRNLNVDPELYASVLPEGAIGPGHGIVEFRRRLSERVPGLRFGYFNPRRESLGRC